MGTNVTIVTANATVLLPCATISTANQVIVTAGTRNVSLRGCSLRGASTASGSQGGTVFLYSGTGAMVQVGDPTYAVDTMGFHMDNAVINATASSSATAKGLAAYRTQEMDVAGLYLLGNSNQTGMMLDGTGNYTGGSFLGDQIIGFQTAVNAIGHEISNPATTDWMNASTFVRLHIDCPTSGGNPIAGTYGINLQQGDGNTFTGGDVEGCSTALHLGANAQNNTIVGLRNENSTSQVVADAGSSYNNWMTGGAMLTGKLTDNGTRNSFLDTFHRSFNGMNGDWYGSQQDATVTNHWRLGIGTGNERGLLNEIQTDYGYRWTEGYSDATSGVQFYQIQDLLNNVPRFSIAQYNNGQSNTNNQTVLNAAGTGAVVLNGSNNSGTGGVAFGSGGASESTVATISNAGNAQLDGTLQVGGTSTFGGSTTVRNQLDAEIDQYLWAGLTTSQKESLIYKDWNGNSQWYMEKDASNNWELNSATGGLDSFKAYQNTNSGDTYINASNPSGVVRINYEGGAGTGFKVYGGSSSSLYASFTGANSIQFPGLAASSGQDCLQVDNSGFLTNTGSACGSGSGGSGTVSSGNAGQIAFYSASGTTIGGMSAVPLAAGGTGASTSAGALANLGVPVYSILNYGAVCGQDSTAAINNAVSAAAGSGTAAKVIIPACANGQPYTVSSSINIGGASSYASNITLESTGGVLLCTMTSGPCVWVAGQFGGPASYNYVNNKLVNLIFEPGVQSSGPSIQDDGWDTSIENPFYISNRAVTSTCPSTPTPGCYFGSLIQVDQDEGFHLKGLNKPAGVLESDSTHVGAAVYNPCGAQGASGLGWISDSDITLTWNQGNGVDWCGGGGLRLDGVVFQDFNEFAVRTNGSTVSATDIHIEQGIATNPNLGGIKAGIGFILNGGSLELHGNINIAISPTLFTAVGTTGSATWYYWVVAKSATYGDSAPMPFGYLANGPATWTTGTTVPLTFPAFIPTGSDTISCSILRTTSSSVAPYPSDGLADVVVSAYGCSAGTSWTYSDSVATSSLGTYSFAVNSSFTPYMSDWVGGILLGGASGSPNNAAHAARYVGQCSSGTSFITTLNYGYAAYPQVTCIGANYPYTGPGGVAGMTAVNATNGFVVNSYPQALMTPNAWAYSGTTNERGVLNFGGGSSAQDIMTLFDSTPWQTQATLGNRPTAVIGDTAIGMANTGVLGLRAPTGICSGIDMLFASTDTYQECLSATAKTFTVPVTATQFNGPLNGNASTATALAATPGQCGSGSYATGVTATGTANCSPVAYSQVSGTPPTSGSGNVALVNAPTFTGNTTTFANNATSPDLIVVEPGTSSTPEAGGFELASQSGTPEFLLEEDTSYDLKIHDSGASTPMDVFTAYINGQTNINSQGSTGVAINNTSSGAGTGGLIVYEGGSNYNTAIAAFTGSTSIKFPGLAASSGHNCAQLDTSGFLTNTGAPCGTANPVATQTWSAAQTLNNGDLVLAGSSGGTTTVETAATGSGVDVLPAAVNSPAKIPQVVYAGTIALATSAILSGACQTVTAGSVNSVAATSVATTDIIDWSPQASLQSVSGYGILTGAALSIDVYPTVSYINVNVCNRAGSTVTPGALTLNVRVIR